VKFDYSFIDIITDKNCLNKIERIAKCKGYETILNHCNITKNHFDLNKVFELTGGKGNTQSQIPEPFQKLRNALDFKKIISGNEIQITELTKKYIHKIYPSSDLSMTEIMLVAGYDVGIGINNSVAVSLDSSILTNINEFISIIIHEVSHTVFEKYAGQLKGNFNMNDINGFKSTVDYLIQYEGVGVFASRDFRKDNNLPNLGNPIIEDYLESSEQIDKLKITYNKLQETKNEANDSLKEELIRDIFGKNRLCHRLGFSIFNNIESIYGLEEVRRAAAMKNSEFKTAYLNELTYLF
jgi:hypothetical protein